MDQRAEYLVQVLEKIGSPLMASITAAARNETDQESAQNMAALLAKSVQAGVDMANAAELSSAGIQDDSLRVALTALASPLVAGIFERTGKLPADVDLKKITAALQAVLSFSDNFTPDSKNIQRLNTLDASGQDVDLLQINVQYIQAVIPAINAVAAFSFGQSEQKLLIEIVSKLLVKASAVRISVLGDLSSEDEKRVDLALLRSLTEIYTACHESETHRLMTMDDEERSNQPQATSGGLALDNVWKIFDLRVAMLESLAENTLPITKTSSSKTPVVSDKQPESPAIVQDSVKEEPVTIVEEPAKQEESLLKTTVNPMAMFAKPKKDNDNVDGDES
ncbi:MAG: hypothetical protein KAJ86_00945 [Alphaproteobacteria bacterium]|nr:hypothetical protein [Alphaproteobacteria bacterium]